MALRRLLHGSVLPRVTGRAFAPAVAPFSTEAGETVRATLFPGDGIGPEIAESVKQVFNVAGVPIEWEEHYVGTEVDPRTESFLTWESLESVRRNKVGLKGPMATPIGKGHRSLNLTLRKELGLYANVRPCNSLPGYKTRYDDVNLVTIRENTEGEYSGLEHQVVRGVVESLKIITRRPRPAADTALHFVQEAFADLSKNASSDTAPAAASTPASGGASAAAADADAFWTACPYCCHVYQYQRALVGRALRCQSAGCRRAFVATEIPTVPPIVPGTDMYYCAWGFFPIGFPKAADLSTNWRPFCPMFPGNFQSSPQPASAGAANVNHINVQSPPQPASAGTANIDPRNFQSPPQTAPAGTANVDSRNFQSKQQPAPAGTANIDVHNVENNGISINANSTPANVQPANKSGVRGSPAGPSRGRMKKTTARKKVGAVLMKQASSGVESGIEPSMLGSDSWNGNAGSGSGSAQTAGTREININEVAKPTDGATMLNFGGDEDIGFDLDVDATDAILGNLQHLPFLREDDNTRRMF